MNRFVVDAMPSVWWPWACQLLAVDTTTRSVGLDFVALEACRVRGAVVEAGTVFTLRASGANSDLAVVADWSVTGTTVTLLAGHHRRSSWACLSAGHRRVLLTDVESNLGVVAPTERPVTAATPRELEPARTTHRYTQE
jgi:hypothetical protein